MSHAESQISNLGGKHLRWIAHVERPVGTLNVFIFLHNSKDATMTDFISAGWNRRTIERSLKRLVKLDLVDKRQTSRFPRFEKRYSLTPSGTYVARFADTLKETCERCARYSFEEMKNLPKGSMPLLVYFSRREWQGISDVLKETGLSANQAYKCLRALEKAAILSIEQQDGRRTRILSCKLTSMGSRISLVVDALASALEKSLSRTNIGV